ncbi:RSP_2648 family PIN domain-containing protein [Aestuariivita sp.]|jgi:predicted nucleic acid-binding protein|uniref:RSP_2648 family PIN domain-containing protein n=1 Tax=Aestuariivita sp. TaxID=1872407 RepID=UPI002170274F|nr:PIN domain-containing protein [Aestuariivita sp.]MCE8008089.1 PIN domain-containing protein [Aestuariivita sp.]
MKLVLDACVLYPTVMREVLLGAAKAGFFAPVWSARILEEWARAAARLNPAQKVQARGEIALARAAFPQAEAPPAPGLEARLWLPDPSDIHVLAVAVASSADGIVTLNARDFPRGLLAEDGLQRYDPDGVLMDFWQADPDTIATVGAAVLAQARALSGEPWEIRPLLKKARLPRLGKALAG